MDPDATWTMLCAALTELGLHPDDTENRAHAVELLEALATWLRKGGFPPTRAFDEQRLAAFEDVLTRLLAWAEYMGGWEAPVWEDARRLLGQSEADEPYTEETPCG